jgi:hypothetical protein
VYIYIYIIYTIILRVGGGVQTHLEDNLRSLFNHTLRERVTNKVRKISVTYERCPFPPTSQRTIKNCVFVASCASYLTFRKTSKIVVLVTSGGHSNSRIRHSLYENLFRNKALILNFVILRGNITKTERLKG